MNLNKFDIFVFDFDGLLANTEQIHYKAYKLAAKNRNVEIDWDFKEYCLNAHFGENSLADSLFKSFPKLQETDWETFYAEKKNAFITLVEKEQSVSLMPGTTEILTKLNELKKPRCVVTNSTKELINSVKNIPENLLLCSIETWFTRGTYKNAKPHPECYIDSIINMIPDDFNATVLNVIGFEDTPRGLKALIDARHHFKHNKANDKIQINLIAVFVTDVDYPELNKYLESGDVDMVEFVQMNSLTQFLNDETMIERVSSLLIEPNVSVDDTDAK